MNASYSSDPRPVPSALTHPLRGGAMSLPYDASMTEEKTLKVLDVQPSGDDRQRDKKSTFYVTMVVKRGQNPLK